MKLIYPARPVEDLYLSGFTLVDTFYEGLVLSQNMEAGWNLISAQALEGRGIIARLGVKLRTSDWTAGNTLGWRVAIEMGGGEPYELANQVWRYGEVPNLWRWDFYPRLPFFESAQLNFYLFYMEGYGEYGYLLRYLLQDYS